MPENPRSENTLLNRTPGGVSCEHWVFKNIVYWNLFVLVHAASKPLQNIPDPNILAIV